VNYFKKTILCFLIGAHAFIAPCLQAEIENANAFSSVKSFLDDTFQSLKNGPNAVFMIEAPGFQYTYQEDLAIIPGSLQKLLVALLAWRIWGPGHTFTTTLSQINTYEFLLNCKGDPTLTHESIAQFLSETMAATPKATLHITSPLPQFPETSPDWMLEDFPSSYVGTISPYQLDNGRLPYKINACALPLPMGAQTF
jgi:D-alanyl-D-alanine carboxypeptidase